jgi:PAS domain S-box-containing protein
MDAMLDALPCGVVSFADDGTVLVANTTVARMLGYERAEIEGRHIETLLTIAGRIFFQTHMYPLVRLHGRAEELFVLMKRKDGSDVGALVNAVRRERGPESTIDCAIMEVRERRKYEDALLRAKQAADAARAEVEEANHAKSQFLAVMSHELRTPLNAIGGYTQLIELGVHGPISDGQRDALERIMNAQRHLLRLINDVLELSRIEAGRVDFTLENVAVAEVITSVMPMLEPQMAAGGLTSTMAVPADLVVRADREKMQQILINRLTNAVKFTAAGGSVSIDASADRANRQARVSVTDSGIGIAASKLASVFEPFVQVDVSQAGRKKGSGLGLAISRDLARGMSGDVVAHCAEGHGSTFTLLLPQGG